VLTATRGAGRETHGGKATSPKADRLGDRAADLAIHLSFQPAKQFFRRGKGRVSMTWTLEPGEPSPDALTGLREARRLLKRPCAPTIEACVPHLETAIRRLSALESQLRISGMGLAERGAIRDELQQIRREMRHVNALMESAGRFYAGLAQVLAAASQSAIYTPQGRIETPTGRGSLRVEG